MAELIRKENNLPTIKVNLSDSSLSGDSPDVVLEVSRGREVVGRVALRSEDLNIPPDFDPAAVHYWDPQFAISQRFWPAIRGPAERARGSERALWLQLAPPVGHLAVLPWERMLEPVVGPTPIVRIPNFTLFTPLSVDRIDIAVCLSEPEAKSRFDGAGFMRRFAPTLLDRHQGELHVHVFSDAETYANLMEIPQAELGSGVGRLHLHDPARAPNAIRSASKGSISDPTGAINSPWLLWMIDELRELTIDVVHFVTHGYLRSGQSALAVAESPMRNEDRIWARFIGPNQVAACLAQLGAWAVGFTSPPENFSTMGLRQFYDDVARLRAGPIVYHDAREDQQAEDLAGAYAGLFMGASPAFRRAVSMYAHPGLFAGKTLPEGFADSFADALVSKSLGPPTPTTEAWVTSTQRYLEQAVARLFPEQRLPNSKIEQATGRGVEHALRFVSEVLRTVGSKDK